MNSQQSATDFGHLLGGKFPGLSDKQLQAHIELYRGYVKKTNEIETELAKIPPNEANYSYAAYSELQRRRAVPYNGARLHQLYFENLSPTKTHPGKNLLAAIEACFGSFEKWTEDLRGGLMSAHGWVLLTQSRMDGLLRNNVIEEHHRGIMVEEMIILAVDGWEHAYMIDYGINKKEYIKTVENLLNWDVATERFESIQMMLKGPKTAAA